MQSINHSLLYINALNGKELIRDGFDQAKKTYSERLNDGSTPPNGLPDKNVASEGNTSQSTMTILSIILTVS
jgi:hypothetical protein